MGDFRDQEAAHRPSAAWRSKPVSGAPSKLGIANVSEIQGLLRTASEVRVRGRPGGCGSQIAYVLSDGWASSPPLKDREV